MQTPERTSWKATQDQGGTPGCRPLSACDSGGAVSGCWGVGTSPGWVGATSALPAGPHCAPVAQRWPWMAGDLMQRARWTSCWERTSEGKGR